MKHKTILLLFLVLLAAFLTGSFGDEAAAQANAPTPETTAIVRNDDNAGEEISEGDNMKSSERTPLQKVTYLWAEDNMPSTTVYTDSNSSYSDPPGFRPNMVFYPAQEGVAVKGAVLICASGAFQFRAEGDEAPVAAGLNALGYHCFVVEYRLRPYTQEEAALDLARAVRYVRSYAGDFGMDENNIATIGFSAGGILCGEQALNFTGAVDGTALDESYTPDALDQVPADVGAVAMVYSFYGRLSVASTDVEKFKESGLPPTYFLYGSEEIFRGQIEACAEAVSQAGVPVESRMLDGWQHGFGAAGDWFAGFDAWLSPIFAKHGSKTITITMDGASVTAELHDSEIARQFASLLPQTISMTRGRDREYYGRIDGTLDYDEGDIQTFAEDGDLAYWFSGNSLAFFFNTENDSAVNSGIVVFLPPWRQRVFQHDKHHRAA